MLGRFCVARMIFFEIDDFQNHFVTKMVLLIFWFTRDENIKPTNDPIGFRVTGQSLKLTFQLYGDKKRPKRIQNGTCWCWSMWYNCRIGIHRLESDRWIEIPPDISWTIIELSERIGRLRGSLILGINPRGFFTFRNQLSNGFTFECQSLINSKVSITSIYSDGDVEHHSSELMQQVTLQYSIVPGVIYAHGPRIVQIWTNGPTRTINPVYNALAL